MKASERCKSFLAPVTLSLLAFAAMSAALYIQSDWLASKSQPAIIYEVQQSDLKANGLFIVACLLMSAMYLGFSGDIKRTYPNISRIAFFGFALAGALFPNTIEADSNHVQVLYF